MNKIAVVTDSTADLPKELAEKNNISVIPLKVFFGDDEYLDGVNLPHGEFIKKLKTSEVFPTTSQPSPGEFMMLYKKLAEQGYDKIISLHISSKLSGTVDSAKMAKPMVKDIDIRIVDSLNTSLGLGLLALRASSLAKDTGNIDELLKTIEPEIKGIKIFFSVSSLDHLIKNGRIGKAQGFFGNLLDLKPLLAIQDGLGEIIPLKKVKGKDKVVDEIIGLITNSYEKNKCKYGIGIVHSGMEEEAKYIQKTLSEKIGNETIITGNVGAVIGSHVGPEVIGIGIY